MALARLIQIGFILAAHMLLVADVSAREIHVSVNGDDSAKGNQKRPFRTIQKAATEAQPGDVVTVHAGIYRETIKPSRGGTGEDSRIVYRAAPGEEVFIKGSERITSWKRQENGVWKVELPGSFFGDYNPYALKLSGGWLNYGNWHHRGDVYLDGEAFYEKQTSEEVQKNKHSWHCRVESGRTTIIANFGDADPNSRLTEINVRETLFMPEVTGLKYITVDGFHFMHAAANWAPPGIELQTGAVGTRMGKYWIIQNCRITNARCVGIILGHAPGVNYDDIDAFGDHVIRNNIIRRCGQAGIAGQKGATRCVITGNLIEDTNYRREFGGWETAAIKFHQSVDFIVSNNLIRGVFRQKQGAFGIWIDFGNQSFRISRNIIYNTEAATVFLEMNHGPILVDNNVLIGNRVRSNSEATVFAHNLFVDCPYAYLRDKERKSAYFKPHTRTVIGRKLCVPRDDKWFNNIFVRKGLDMVKQAPGYESNYNVFLEGARKSVFGDEKSLVAADAADVVVQDLPLGAKITFTMGDVTTRVEGPLVNAKLVGVFANVGQSLEDRYGKPITVGEDIRTKSFSPTLPGPLAELKKGKNQINWSIKGR